MTYFPIFQGITHFANPKLEAALAASPVTVTADPAECSFQFKATGTEKFTTGCDIIKAALVGLSVNYDNVDAPKGTAAEREDRRADARRATRRTPPRRSPPRSRPTAIRPSADPSDINYVMTVMLLTILVVYVTMVYGPIAAWLVELFPTRIRYSGVSLPYHIGNGWFGGFLPATVFAIVAATGNIYSGLWYPIMLASISDRRLPFLPETNDIDSSPSRRGSLTSDNRPRAARPVFHLGGQTTVQLVYDHFALIARPYELQHDLATMRAPSMLDQINCLPRSQRKLAFENRDVQRCRGQHRLDVGGHVVLDPPHHGSIHLPPGPAYQAPSTSRGAPTDRRSPEW